MVHIQVISMSWRTKINKASHHLTSISNGILNRESQIQVYQLTAFIPRQCKFINLFISGNNLITNSQYTSRDGHEASKIDTDT